MNTPEAVRPPLFHRSVRSFVIRAARLTPGQKRALDELYPVFGVPFPPAPDFAALFPGLSRFVIEIGFGNGAATLEIAAADPATGFLGIEVHPPGVGHLLMKLAERGLTNLKVLQYDAIDVLEALPPDSIDAFHVFFPDPWPKKKHHKRRLLQTPVLMEIARALKPGGVFYLATDWDEYASEVLAALGALPAYEAAPGVAVAHRPTTRFEARGLAESRPIRELVYRKRSTP
ncbi:MAG: tRNA (guanosine(46)-N7)-methyltransferase TrmB [Spirochaetales bacterium]